jgi:hypothetical protein
MAKLPPCHEGPIKAELLCDLLPFEHRTLLSMHSFFQQLLIFIQDSFGSQDVDFKVPIGKYYDLDATYRKHKEHDEFLVSYTPKTLTLKHLDGCGRSELVIGTHALTCFYMSAMKYDVKE